MKKTVVYKRKVGRPKKTKQDTLIDSLHATAMDIESVWIASNPDPKAAHGKAKPSTFGIPPVALIQLGEAMQTGIEKYGLFNWRGSEVRSSVYYNAIMRHLMQWRDGEMIDEDSGLHPLAHVMASCAILIDAEAQDTLLDDRSVSGQAVREIKRLTKE